MRSKQPPYDYGLLAPADVQPARTRLPEAVTDKEGNVYDGEVRQDAPHIREGRGLLVKKDGALYEGWFRNNKFHGRGRVISA